MRTKQMSHSNDLRMGCAAVQVILERLTELDKIQV